MPVPLTRNAVRLFGCLDLTYCELLRLPLDDEFRTRHQSLFASVRDALAELSLKHSEEVQTEYEEMVGGELGHGPDGYRFAEGRDE